MLSIGFKNLEIERFGNESFQDYLERCYFIGNNLRNKKYTYEELVDKSMLFYYIKVLKCGYSDDIMNEIKEMSKFAGVKLEK